MVTDDQGHVPRRGVTPGSALDGVCAHHEALKDGIKGAVVIGEFSVGSGCESQPEPKEDPDDQTYDGPERV
ncbi:hypothetical protein, partial [Leisingera daeponensis]|uniref:hypothetical protein n=1 Tax=Leisingera daeponensis TaxID=405746 RepID=UPI001C98DF09